MGLLLGSCARAETPGAATTFVLATTTSTQDSGFLDALAPSFESDHPSLKMKAIAVGSGEALELGRRGDADVLLVHSPDDEARFMQEGYGISRRPVMSNDFVIVGPPADPAGIAGGTDAAEAFRAIASGGHRFVSRGDESGTHKKELKLWKSAGLEPKGAWYLSSGQGMAETLIVSSESAAYTLTDSATFTVVRDKVNLTILFAANIELVNPYSVIPVKGARNGEGAMAFADWITGPGGQRFIDTFGKKAYGEPLFVRAGAK